MTVTEIGVGAGTAGPVTAGAAPRGGRVVTPVGESGAFAALMDQAKVRDAGEPVSAKPVSVKTAAPHGTAAAPGIRQGADGLEGAGRPEDRKAAPEQPASDATAPVLAGPADKDALSAAIAPSGDDDDMETSPGSAAPRQEPQADAADGADTGPPHNTRDADAASTAQHTMPPPLHAPGSSGAALDAGSRPRDQRGGGLSEQDGSQEVRHVETPARRAVAASGRDGVPDNGGADTAAAGAAPGQPPGRSPMVFLDESETVPVREDTATTFAGHALASQAEVIAVVQAREPSHETEPRALHTPSLAGPRPNHPREADAEGHLARANSPLGTPNASIEQAVTQETPETELGTSRLSSSSERQGGSVDTAINAAASPVSRHPAPPPPSVPELRMPAMVAGAVLATQTGAAARQSARTAPYVRETALAFTRTDTNAAFANASSAVNTRPAAPPVAALVFPSSPQATPGTTLAAGIGVASDKATFGDTALAAPDLRTATSQTPPPAPPVTPDAAAHHVPRQVALRVVQAAEGSAGGLRGTVELTLSPEELGRVRLRLHPSDAGLSVTITADRAETLDLMRRNIDSLAREFLEIGYEGAQFDFAQSEQGGQDAEGRSGAPGAPAPAAPTVAAADRPQPAREALLLLSERLDIRL